MMNESGEANQKSLRNFCHEHESMQWRMSAVLFSRSPPFIYLQNTLIS